MSLFDSYLVVDWSAAGTPRRGADSIWLALAGPAGLCRLWNPATRREAEDLIAGLLEAEQGAGRRVLAGFDFPFGYPRGAARLLTGRDGWSALWEAIGTEVREGPDNANDRFDAAARLNARVAGDGPFWANGLARDIDGLPRRCPVGWGDTLPTRRRLIERRVPGAQETWKLSGAGSVGGQALVGIAALDRLRRREALAGSVAVWPFEPISGRPIVFAEIYPSLWPPDPRESVKDAGQVRAVAEHFHALDAAGSFAALLSVPEELEADDRTAVLSEEAWMLGADRDGRPAARQASPLVGGAEGVTAMADAAAADHAAGADRGGGAATAFQARATGDRGEGARSSTDAVVAEHAVRGAAASDATGRGAGAADATPAPRLSYERDPAEIYRKSFAAARAEARLGHLPEELREVAVRLVHACGMPEITARLAWSAGVAAAGRAALCRGAPVLCDCNALAAMVIRERLPRGNEVLCTLGDPAVPEIARRGGNTRSAAAVELWRDRVEGALVAIGNAPTALFRLLELIDGGWPRPAAILAFPVGFVGAAESKAELAARPRGVPFLTLRGRRGGSAMAAAAVNALAAAGGT